MSSHKPRATGEDIAALNRLMLLAGATQEDLYGEDWLLTPSEARGSIQLLEKRLGSTNRKLLGDVDQNIADLFGAREER